MEYEVNGSRLKYKPEDLVRGCAKRLSKTQNGEDAMNCNRWGD